MINIDYRYSPSQNNGQITSMKNMMSGEEVAYQYDGLQRLISASTTGPEWGLSFSYDGFGNRLNQTVTKGSAPPSTLSYSAATNRIITSGYSYDANGNMTAMPLMTLSYDVSNRLAQAVHTVNGTETYRYTPDNKRVWRKVQSSNSTSEYITFYGIDGQRMAMYKVEDQGSDFRFYHNQIWRYFAGRRVLPKEDIQPSQAEDRIGSVVTANARFYPYGEEGTVTNPEGDKFATYYRDRTTLDYADQRYYAPGSGRFLTADPYVASGEVLRPGSWNRYAYVSGDPVNFNDPWGLFECPASTPTSVTVCDTAPLVETYPAERRQNSEYMEYYYSGAYFGASPYGPQPDPREIMSEADRQERLDCYRRVVEGSDEARRVARLWIDDVFDDKKMPVPSLITIIRSAIIGAEKGIEGGPTGVAGALVGATIGAVVSMGAAAITNPVLKPVLRNIAYGLLEVEIARSAQELRDVLCDKNPFVQNLIL